MDSISTTRLFVALWPDPEIRHALRERRDAWDWPRGASPVHTDKLHMTLHFLGGIPTEKVPALQAGLAVPFTPFLLSLGVPKLWSHGIAVLEPNAESPELLDLYGNLASQLVALGVEPEARKFRPHVTLARRANSAVVPPVGEALVWNITGYALVESKTGNGGSYAVLQEYS